MRPLRRLKTLLIILFLATIFRPVSGEASSSIVISQIYGGGGNSGATLKNDFVELFNRSSATVSVEGWTIQYASSTGSSWDRTTLTGSIEPGQYYLVALAAGTGGTVNLPAAQATGGTNLSATTGKIALVNTDALLSGACPTGVVDLVGYGTANCSESSPAPALTNTTALIRAGNGCTDTDNNSSDFATGTPSPRNASSPRTNCNETITPTPAPTPTPTPTQAASRRTIGDASLIFPHFAQGSGYQTTFTFNNLSNTAATITLNFYAQSGTLTNSITVPIA